MKERAVLTALKQLFFITQVDESSTGVDLIIILIP